MAFSHRFLAEAGTEEAGPGSLQGTHESLAPSCLFGLRPSDPGTGENGELGQNGVHPKMVVWVSLCPLPQPGAKRANPPMQVLRLDPILSSSCKLWSYCKQMRLVQSPELCKHPAGSPILVG